MARLNGRRAAVVLDEQASALDRGCRAGPRALGRPDRRKGDDARRGAAAARAAGATAGRILWVSEQTVSNVYRELGVGNRSAASRRALSFDLIGGDLESTEGSGQNAG